MCRPSSLRAPRQPHLYPSEASVTWKDSSGDRQVAGCCLRAAYFRYTGSAPAGPKTPYSEWIFTLGKAVEEKLIENWKQMGIWVANNVEFYWKEYNIKGELDVLLKDPNTGELFITEVKSFAGYNAAKEICGNFKTKARPKTSQMLQAIVYLYFFQYQIPYVKMAYYGRDTSKRIEFDLTLVPEGPNQTRVAINGEVDTRFYVENILNRYRELDQYVQLGQVPPPDYELEWSPATIEKEYAKGNIGKTVYEKWKKKPSANPIGSWRCRSAYCGFSSICWGKTLSNEEEDS